MITFILIIILSWLIAYAASKAGEYLLKTDESYEEIMKAAQKLHNKKSRTQNDPP